jgi:hypothetical protein
LLLSIYPALNNMMLVKRMALDLLVLAALSPLTAYGKDSNGFFQGR